MLSCSTPAPCHARKEKQSGYLTTANRCKEMGGNSVLVKGEKGGSQNKEIAVNGTLGSVDSESHVEVTTLRNADHGTQKSTERRKSDFTKSLVCK